MRKKFTMPTEIVPEFFAKASAGVESINEFFKARLEIQDSFLSILDQKTSMTNVELIIDEQFNFKYIGYSVRYKEPEQEAFSYKLKVWDEEYKDFIMENKDSLQCDLCFVDRPRNESHFVVINNEPKVFGSSCIKKFMPDTWEKLSYIREIEEALDDFVVDRMSNGNNYLNQTFLKQELFAVSLEIYSLYSRLQMKTSEARHIISMSRTSENKEDREFANKIIEAGTKKYSSHYDRFVTWCSENEDVIGFEAYVNICHSKSEYTHNTYAITSAAYKFEKVNNVTLDWLDEIKSRFIDDSKNPKYPQGEKLSKQKFLILNISKVFCVQFNNTYTEKVWVTYQAQNGQIFKYSTSSKWFVPYANENNEYTSHVNIGDVVIMSVTVGNTNYDEYVKQNVTFGKFVTPRKYEEFMYESSKF